MLSLYDWDKSFDTLRREMAQMLDEFEGGRWTSPSLLGGNQVWPRVALSDAGDRLVLWAEVPGLSHKDIQISLEQDVLTITGERKPARIEGYVMHRSERDAFRFTRAFALPCKVDGDHVQANVKDGVLTIALPKMPEARPKHIEIKAS